MSLVIRKIDKEEIPQALSLVWRVFQEYEASDYTQEGVEEFYKSIHDEDYLSNLCMYGAFERDELLGVIATRIKGTHIALFFVDGRHHRQGIGKQLFQAALLECPSEKMTVNSSPFAVPVYHKLGFVDTDTEQVVNGLRFTPMERTEKKRKGEEDMEKKSIRELVSVVFKAVTLAMGVAVVVLSCLGSFELQTAITMLGIGLACSGAAMLAKE